MLFWLGGRNPELTMNDPTPIQTELTPREAMVFDVYQRLESVGLTPTIEVVASLARLNVAATMDLCKSLEAKGKLVRGSDRARSARSFTIARDASNAA